MHSADISIEHLTKVEGSASLDVKVRDNKVQSVQFKITEYKRFFIEAMRGKKITELPSMLARICGTCSNAHLICAIEAGENALGIKPTEQTLLLRYLTMYGLMIRDHALHLYIFVMPDLFGKSSFLDFDENDTEQHQLLHDAFAVKDSGNFLATLVAGRSVHATLPVVGGFVRVPEGTAIKQAVEKLEKARLAVLRLIKIFKDAPWHLDRETNFMALVSKRYGFLEGCINTGHGDCLQEQYYRNHLEKVVVPYSQADAYKHKGESYMVGALARINLSRDRLHARTQADASEALRLFPSTDIYNNNLAQAIEILHSIDDAIEILQNNKFVKEPIIKKEPRETVGIGVIEAPRGTLYHEIVVGANGLVADGEVVVPTGQNQINIEEDIKRLVQDLLGHATNDEITFEIEKLIRAYDPCMSCASHFLKIKWR